MKNDKYRSLEGPNISQIIMFEVISYFGRNFKNKSIRIKPEQNPILLDIGAGSNYSDKWIHADFFLTPRWKFWKSYPQRFKPELELDLRYPINLKDNFADGIYSGHTLEHFYPKDALNLLKEIFRILKPLCWLRINVPDLEKYVNFYIGREEAPEFSKFTNGCEAIRSLTQNHGHHSVWDEKLLTSVLKDVGFINIKKVEYGKEGNDKRLIKEEEVRKWETIVLEGQKPN